MSFVRTVIAEIHRIVNYLERGTSDGVRSLCLTVLDNKAKNVTRDPFSMGGDVMEYSRTLLDRTFRYIHCSIFSIDRKRRDHIINILAPDIFEAIARIPKIIRSHMTTVVSLESTLIASFPSDLPNNLSESSSVDVMVELMLGYARHSVPVTTMMAHMHMMINKSNDSDIITAYIMYVVLS